MISDKFCLRLENRLCGTIEDLYNSIRNWQDYRKIQLHSLVSVPAKDGGTAVDTYFRSGRGLALLCDEFGRRYYLSTP